MAGNAMSGGIKKPTSMKILEGTFRKDRANPAEPKFTLVKIAPPPFVELNEYGMKEWERQTANLIETGVIANTDLSALSAMCYEWGEYVLCGVQINGVTRSDEYEDKVFEKLEPKEWVEYCQIKFLAGKELKRLRKEHLEAYHKLSVQFGLTPASRPKVSGMMPEPKDELDDL